MKLEEALRQLKVGKKARRLLSLWPTIEAKLEEGVSHREILCLLNENGFELTERTYKSYLYRYRKRLRATGQKGGPMRLPGNTNTQACDLARAATSPASADVEKQSRPPTFDYDPSGIPELLK
jgi:hypothetical protein